MEGRGSCASQATVKSFVGRRILGIDPGTRMVGYGVLDMRVEGFRYVECGSVRLNPGDMPERLLELSQYLEELLSEFSPTDVVIEQAFHGPNAASALKLGQARGTIILMAARRGLVISEYAPATIKHTVVGHGRATKEAVKRRVRLLCNLRSEPQSDAADGLAIALCHAILACSL